MRTTQLPTFRATQTRSEVRRLVINAFQKAGLATPDLDARRLTSWALGVDDIQLLTGGDVVIGEVGAACLSDVCQRRLAGEPVSRIIGTRNFLGHDFAISPAVLDPRPETEALVEIVTSALADRLSPPRIADIGTGSGAIIISLALALPAARCVATDISAHALAVARENATRLGVADRIHFLETDILLGHDGEFDVIVSNPPYIPTADVACLAPEVTHHDPHLALDGGPDGLDVYRKISSYMNKLCVGGLLALEVGAGQAHDVAELFVSAGLTLKAIHKDLSGHERIVVLVRQL